MKTSKCVVQLAVGILVVAVLAGVALVKTTVSDEKQPYVGDPAGRDTKLCFSEDNDRIMRPYRLFVPSAYQWTPSPGEDVAPKFPLILMFHGGGSANYPCDENWFFANKETPERVQAFAEKRGYVVACPAMPYVRIPAGGEDRRERYKNAVLDHDVPLVMNIVRDITYNMNIDENRIYLAGASRGGFVTYFTAHAHPDKFAAIAAICSHAPDEMLDNIAKTPTLILHAKDDTIIAIQEARDLKQRLLDRGGEVDMHEFPGPHDGLRNSRAYRLIFDWFDAHKLDK